MSSEANSIESISSAWVAQVAKAGQRVVAIRNSAHRHITGLLWQPDLVVTSEQAMGDRDEYEVVNAQGTTAQARIAGRDPGTNLLLLKLGSALPCGEILRAEARPAALVLAIGADVNGATTARSGIVNAVGQQWYSRVGGRIEQRIALDIRLGRTEEGGAVIDAGGALLGMSTLGPPGQVLAIPHATIERIVPQLAKDGYVQRGWVGLGLQPIEVPEALREAAGQSAGMIVMSVAQHGPGANAGVTVGDILLTIDSVPVRKLRRLAAQLDADSVGKNMPLRLVRAGEIVTLTAEITARPERTK
jgi:S1-C subfamily serine protease